MTTPPSEPPQWAAFPDYQPPAYTPPPTYAPPPEEPAPSRPPRVRIGPRRLIVGVLWGAIALICAAGAVGEFLVGIPGGGVLCVIIAVGSGWYDYRVWTRRSRRLIV